MEHGDLIRDAYASFVKKKENAIIEKLVELFNDGTLELLVNERIVNDINKITIGGGIGIRIPKLIDAQARIASLEAQLEKAEKVIEFYGAKENWRDEVDSGVKVFGPFKDHKTWTDCGYEYDWENLHDEGDIARE